MPRIVLPPTRELEVTVRDAWGRCLRPGENEDRPVVELARQRLAFARRAWRDRLVPTNRRFELRITHRGVQCTREVTLAPGPGPQRVEVRMGARATVYRGRAISETGQVMPGIELAVYGAGLPVSVERRCTIDAQGRFCWVAGPASEGATAWWLQVVRMARLRPGPARSMGVRNLAARVEVVSGERGRFDVGDVRFRPAPLLAEGRAVVRPSDRAADVRRGLRVEEWFDGHWCPVPGAAIEWPAADRFVLHGHARSARLRLCAASVRVPFGRLPLPSLAFQKGDRALRLDCVLPGEIGIDLLAADASRAARIRIVARQGGVAVACGASAVDLPVSFDESGVHRIAILTPLAPGRYRVDVLDGEGVELRVLDDVEVHSAQRARPLRASPLDLRVR